MSGPTAPQSEDQDGSMDSILASIRRIIMEDEAGASAARQTGVADDQDDELLVLKPSMVVRSAEQEAEPMQAVPSNTQGRSAAELAAALFDDEPPKPNAAPSEPAHGPANEPPAAAGPEHPLLAPETRLAASQSLASLQNAIRTDPEPPATLPLLRSGGPTLEDMVRDELRGQLKAWLDTNLPDMVERLVRQEIERLVRPA